MWQDVKQFLENPGETLERVREQLKGGDSSAAEDLGQRRKGLAKRLANKTAEKDRYVRLYAQGHIFESELEVYLADLKNQTDNLRLLLESVEADLSQKRERRELAETTHAWLVTLRQRLVEVEKDTEEAFHARRQLVRLLVAEITAGKRTEDGSTKVRITYRFGPPGEEGEDEGEAGEPFVDGVRNSVGYFSPKPTIRSNAMCANHTRATETTRGLSASRPRTARRPGAA